MASIRKRNGKYQVQVRLAGHSAGKTFFNLKDARKWATYYENKINLGNELEVLDNKLTLGHLINKYLTEITPSKKGWHMESIRLQRLLRQSI